MERLPGALTSGMDLTDGLAEFLYTIGDGNGLGDVCQDSDGDGLPDFWEKQFGLDPNDAGDNARISAYGYANIEHYFNNTDPTGGTTPIIFIAAAPTMSGR